MVWEEIVVVTSEKFVYCGRFGDWILYFMLDLGIKEENMVIDLINFNLASPDIHTNSRPKFKSDSQKHIQKSINPQKTIDTEIKSLNVA